MSPGSILKISLPPKNGFRCDRPRWGSVAVLAAHSPRLYLLRDSHHIGVHYGRFDFRRLISSVIAIRGEANESPRLGIEEGGWHAAEALVLARYFMFTQIYFHKTRVAYDWHMREALKVMLPGG